MPVQVDLEELSSLPSQTIFCLDHGYVTLRNIAGPVRRPELAFDARDIDPANSARFSFDAADKTDRSEDQDLKLDDYLLKNRHTTPFEMIIIWLEMKMPIFVARQFVRHRTVSINEVSARYVKLPNEFYIPEASVVGIKASTNKQGRDIVNIDDPKYNSIVKDFRTTLAGHCEMAYSHYQHFIDNGIPNELARSILPLNIYTKWLWKQDLWNMMHFLMLRLDSHAQYEARVYAQAVYDLLAQVLPHCMSLFDRHIRRIG